jgi:mannosyltransferase OCH1-like enzyme
MIPKIIHQIWFDLEGTSGSLESKPEYYEPHKKMKTFCEEHNITLKLWNIQQCREICQDHQELWFKFRYDIQRIDFVRYVILQQEGGIYVDMDIYPVKPIDHLFERNELFVRWADQKDCYNAIMGSHPNHDIWEKIITHCYESTERVQGMKIYDVWKGRSVAHSTGCRMLTRALKKNKYNYQQYQEIVRVYNPKIKLLSEPKDYLFQDGSVSGWWAEMDVVLKHQSGIFKKHRIPT